MYDSGTIALRCSLGVSQWELAGMLEGRPLGVISRVSNLNVWSSSSELSLHVTSHVSFKRAPRKFLQKHCNRAWVVFRIRLVRTTLLPRLVWSWPVVRSYTAPRLRARRLSHCGRPYPILLDLTGTFRSLHISYLWFFAYLALALHIFYLPCHRVASKPLFQLYLPVNWQGKGKTRFSKGTSIEFPSDGIEGAIAIYVCLLEETSSSLLARREGVTFCAVRTVGWL